MPLMRISNPETIAVTNALPEKYYEEFIEKQSRMEVYVHRPNSDNPPQPASIFSVSDFIDFQSKTFVVKSSFDRNPVNWVPGMFVKTEFVLESKRDIYMLPFELLVAGERLWIVERSEENPESGTARMITFVPTYYNADFFCRFVDLCFRLYFGNGRCATNCCAYDCPSLGFGSSRILCGSCFNFIGWCVVYFQSYGSSFYGICNYWNKLCSICNNGVD